MATSHQVPHEGIVMFMLGVSRTLVLALDRARRRPGEVGLRVCDSAWFSALPTGPDGR